MWSPPEATAQRERIPSRRKRVVTEARKEQNRMAQRAYRRRQREERLKNAQPPRTQRYPTLRPLPPLQNPPSHGPIPRGSTNLSDPIAGLAADLDWNSDPGMPDRIDNVARAVSNMPGVSGPDVESSDGLLNVATDPFCTFELGVPGDSQNSDPNRQDLFSGEPLLIEGIAESDVELNQAALPAPEDGVTRPALADLYLNRLQLPKTSLLQAFAFNARCLGIGPEEFASYSCLSFCSPFYRPVTMTDDPQGLLAAVSRPAIPPHLQPTLPQVLFPHHPILDLLPLPGLRARAIMLAATAPFLLDAFDFKKDVVDGGLICWAARRGGNDQPWDKRSWEAAPWFLRKWRLLVDGPQSDLWQQSAWWQGMRGEVPVW
ncbi:hypothetical protein P170DRAFT_473439 [Aspergillus steynii IBT 23096]|uniref:BZIP domain-containing protein n=1 Tax=Aspergillus steynii IBT 23096 TaxID=1392250 RepID=A0A2I2GL35_9EURO|nr:uncharacterized protein P170DRAFT_473439 [Aspergillus steynii IBT 23096]PLB53581.1 hypothetical protein P170DRAFT_473439 [Aspergillus steynii IBT 23096]